MKKPTLIVLAKMIGRGKHKIDEIVQSVVEAGVK